MASICEDVITDGSPYLYNRCICRRHQTHRRLERIQKGRGQRRMFYRHGKAFCIYAAVVMVTIVVIQIVTFNKYMGARGLFEKHRHKRQIPDTGNRNNSHCQLKEDDKQKVGTVNKSTDHVSKPILTLFTTWNDTFNKRFVHENTIRNWELFKPFIQPVVFTNTSSVASACKHHGWGVLPVKKIAHGNRKPILKYMFLEALKNSKTKFVGFANADILFTDGLQKTLQLLIETVVLPVDKPVVIAGARTNVPNITSSEAIQLDKLRHAVTKRGSQFHEIWAADYFITTRDYPWDEFLELVVGLFSFDNFIIWFSRMRNITTIDVSNTVLAAHQTTKLGNFESRNSPARWYNRWLTRQKYPEFGEKFGYLQCTQYLSANSVAEPDTIEIIQRRVRAGTCDEHFHPGKPAKA